MDAARASPMSARMAVSREQDDHPLVPRSVTTAAPDATAACQSLSLRTRWTQQLFSRTHPAGDPAGSGTGALVSLAPPGPRLVMRPAPLMAPRRLQSVDTCMPTSAPTPPERLPLRTITAVQTRSDPPICTDFGLVSVKTMAVQIRTFCGCVRCRAGPASPVRSSLAVDVVYRRAAAWVHRSRPGIGSASAAGQGGVWKGPARYWVSGSAASADNGSGPVRAVAGGVRAAR